MRIMPVMFQDDVMRVVDSIDAARAGNIKVASTMKSKQIKLNEDTTSYIMFGSKKQVENARVEIKQSPITCDNFITNEKICDKWLGDMFHNMGVGCQCSSLN